MTDHVAVAPVPAHTGQVGSGKVGSGKVGSGKVQAVCVTFAVKPDAGTVGRTGIDKRPAERIEVRADGVLGDVVCDELHHGGRDKAVYAYSDADAAWWEHELGAPVPHGWFGENLRLDGVEVSAAVIGERWRLGADVVVEVTQPRIPCATFGRHVEQQRWVRRFSEANRVGAYLRVLAPGTVAPGDPVVVEHVPGHGVTAARWFAESDPADGRTLLVAERDGLDLAPALVAFLERSLRRG